MKQFYTAALICTFLFPSFITYTQVSCSATLQFNWKNASGVGFEWPTTNGQTNVMRTYTKPGVHTKPTVRVVFDHTSKQNIDFSNCGSVLQTKGILSVRINNGASHKLV